MDDKWISMDKLEIPCPPKRVPHKMVVLFLQLLLRQAKEDKAVAINLFRDRIDHCLRALEYVLDSSGTPRPREFAPAPECLSAPVFGELHKLTWYKQGLRDRTLSYVFSGVRCVAQVEWPFPDEIRIYFGELRPPMRTKLGT